MIWKDGEEDDEMGNKDLMHIPAPKMPLPGHAASYRPPDEYLFTEEEKEAWKNMAPEDRDLDFIPQKFDSLRKLGAYPKFVRERFDRCLDLYLCPRSFKRKLNIDPGVHSYFKPVMPHTAHACTGVTQTLHFSYRGHPACMRCSPQRHWCRNSRSRAT